MWPFGSLRQRVITLPSSPSAAVKTVFAPSLFLFLLFFPWGRRWWGPSQKKLCFYILAFLYGRFTFYEVSVLSSPSFKFTTSFLTIFCVLYLKGLSYLFSYFLLYQSFSFSFVRNTLFPTGFFNEVPGFVMSFHFSISFYLSFRLLFYFSFHLFIICYILSIIYNNNIYYNNNEVNFQSTCKLISISSKSWSWSEWIIYMLVILWSHLWSPFQPSY